LTSIVSQSHIIEAVHLPSPDSLRCFVEAARLRSFRSAARVVALTPAAFGARIKQLEEQLGVVLFSRTTRSVMPTEAALSLLPVARRTLDDAAACVRAARGETGPSETELVLGTRHELGLSWVLPQLPTLERRLPYLQLHLYFGSGLDLLLRVRTTEVDCAVTSTRFSDPKLDAIALHREDYVFCGAAELLARVPFEAPRDAARHALLDASADLPLFSYLRDANRAHTFAFARAIRLGSIAAIRQRVLEKAGVAVLPEYLVRKDLASRRLVRLLPKLVPLHDFFRLVFRADDPRRVVFSALATELLRSPLR
jgi:LysR family glycine cleavage system transcriptional activator